MTYSFGDVVLVPFHFSNQAGVKKRPAAIVSSGSYNIHRRDVLIMAITSQVRTPLDFGESHVLDWHAAGLIKPSVFKPVIATIEQSLIVRTMGCLAVTARDMLSNLMGQIFFPD